MNLDTYQEEALRTAAKYPDDDKLLAVCGLGLTGEAGEVADHIKKAVGHGHELDKAKVARELGDVLWYVAVLADAIGHNLDTIATMNISKLRKRYGTQFSPEASVNRKE